MNVYVGRDLPYYIVSHHHVMWWWIFNMWNMHLSIKLLDLSYAEDVFQSTNKYSQETQFYLELSHSFRCIPNNFVYKMI